MNKETGEQLKTLLVAKKLKLAVAESLTAGILQAAIGSISGASAFFEGGITAYTIDQKVRLLAVNKDHAKTVNSVSQQVAFELASGICCLFQCDLGIGTTGYAEPSPENKVDAPMAYFAICRRSGRQVERVIGQQLFGAGLSRLQMQDYVAETALQTLISYLRTCEVHTQ